MPPERRLRARESPLRRGRTGVSRRYARALLDVAREKGDPAALREELNQLAGLTQESPDLLAALTHPAIPAERRKSALQAVATKAGASPLLTKLLEVLFAGDRLGALVEIASAYSTLLNAQLGVVSAEAVSAAPLQAAELDALRNAAAAVSGRDVELQTQVEPEVLGGVLLRMEGRTYDGTVRGRLANLRRRLAEGTPGA